jgi:hypothetical protein
MLNITQTVKGNVLTIQVDLSKRFGPSASGKTMIIASTQGNQKVDGHPAVSFGVNVYTKESQNT